jgi:hypothetical protein
MFEGWDEEDIERINNGLALLGWQLDGRLTADDSLMLEKVAGKVLDLQARGELTEEKVTALSYDAYEILKFQIVSAEERARMVSGPYSRSDFIRPLIPLIDEAILTFYRGYFTASLATLFIFLERYLRTLLGWKPGDDNPSFAKLRTALIKFPENDYRESASKILDGLYAHYDAVSPPPFYFNRHGLLHGLRDAMDADRMNCCRMFILIDLLAMAEADSGWRSVIVDEAFLKRVTAYEGCIYYGKEKQLLGRA